MASVCTRAGKFILARFVTIVGPSRSICSPSASKELLRRGPCQGPYQSSPISGEPSGYQSSGPRFVHPNVGGGASQRIGPKPASNSSARGSTCGQPQVKTIPTIGPALRCTQNTIVSPSAVGPARQGTPPTQKFGSQPGQSQSEVADASPQEAIAAADRVRELERDVALMSSGTAEREPTIMWPSSCRRMLPTALAMWRPFAAHCRCSWRLVIGDMPDGATIAQTQRSDRSTLTTRTVDST